MRDVDSYSVHLHTRRARSHAMRAAWLRMARGLAVRLRGLAGRAATNLRTAA